MLGQTLYPRSGSCNSLQAGRRPSTPSRRTWRSYTTTRTRHRYARWAKWPFFSFAPFHIRTTDSSSRSFPHSGQTCDPFPKYGRNTARFVLRSVPLGELSYELEPRGVSWHSLTSRDERSRSRSFITGLRSAVRRRILNRFTWRSIRAQEESSPCSRPSRIVRSSSTSSP